MAGMAGVMLAVAAFSIVQSERVVLYDSIEKSSLSDWANYSTAHKEKMDEGSYNDKESVIRTISVCDINTTAVHWIRSPFIPRKQGHKLTVDIRFTMRHCVGCKNEFELYYLGSEGFNDSEIHPGWDMDNYRLLDMITPKNQTFNDEKIPIYHETRSVKIQENGVYFSLRFESVCSALISFEVHYLQCPQIQEHLAVFPDTPVEGAAAGLVKAYGKCILHAEADVPPSYLCKSNGDWMIPGGGCSCMKGYERTVTDSHPACTACQPGTFKEDVGNHGCSACPEHSHSFLSGDTWCQCDENYYRASSDLPSAPCTQPPSAVEDLKVSDVGKTSLTLTWSEPLTLGGRTDLTYTAECVGCHSAVLHHAKPDDKRVTISNLDPDSMYTILVWAQNAVSREAGDNMFRSILVTTLPDGDEDSVSHRGNPHSEWETRDRGAGHQHTIIKQPMEVETAYHPKTTKMTPVKDSPSNQSPRLPCGFTVSIFVACSALYMIQYV